MAHISAGMNGLRILIWVMGVVLIAGAVMLTSLVYQQIDRKSKYQGLPCAMSVPEVITAPLPIVQAEIKGGLMVLLSHPAKGATSHTIATREESDPLLTPLLSKQIASDKALRHSATASAKAQQQTVTLVNLCNGEQQTIVVEDR
jgi:hypothetical protein